MSLEPVTSEPGLWRKPGSLSTTPGLHALIVGVSAYPFMAEGDQSDGVSNNFGMGQLLVSAKTAAHVFDWLHNREKVADRPVLSCRLLLSPQKGDELDTVKKLAGDHYASTTFQAITSAIKGWANEFLWVEAALAKYNASLLFFSGHGLEYLSSPTLLASDFLAPPGSAGLQNLIAINGVREALKTYNVGASFYFIDACRNAPVDLMRANPVGDSVLKPLANFAITPDVVVWLQATIPGAFAYQPNEGKDRCTFFGTALLEGLNGVEPDLLPYQVDTDPCQLMFGRLEAYVKRRTSQLLASVNPSLTQLVRAGGDPYEGQTLLAETPKHIFALSHQVEALKRSAGGERTEAPVFRSATQTWRPVDQERKRSIPSKRLELPLQEFVADSTLAHEVFGHEWITEPLLRSLGVRHLGGGGRQSADAAMLHEVRVRHAPAFTTVWMDLLIPPSSVESTLWISMGGAGTKWPMLATVVPGDTGPVPVRLEVVLAAPPRQEPLLAALTTRIGPPGILSGVGRGAAASLWEGVWAAQERESFESVAEAADLVHLPDDVREALLQGTLSPLAAAVSGFVLLRAGKLDQSQSWPKKLASWMSSVECAVLWGEVLSRRLGPSMNDPFDDLNEICQTLLVITRTGIPRLSAALEAAAERTRLLSGACAETCARLQPVADRLERISPYARLGGTFATFGPLPEAFDPETSFRST